MITKLPRYTPSRKAWPELQLIENSDGEWVRTTDVEVLFCEAHQPPHNACPCCEAVHADDEKKAAEADVAALQRERDEILLKDSIKTREINLLVPEVKAAEAALTRLRAQLAQLAAGRDRTMTDDWEDRELDEERDSEMQERLRLAEADAARLRAGIRAVREDILAWSREPDRLMRQACDHWAHLLERLSAEGHPEPR